MNQEKIKQDDLGVAQKLKGTVLRFNPVRGFGFIIPDKPPSKLAGELFFHYSEIEAQKGDYKNIQANQRVEFDILTGADGRLFAIQVARL